jgi:hypothetical protein
MEEPWHAVLKPREAVIAGIVGLVIVWAPLFYAAQVGYVFWGYSPHEWRDLGMAMIALAFAVPYLLVKWILNWRQTDKSG